MNYLSELSLDYSKATLLATGRNIEMIIHIIHRYKIVKKNLKKRLYIVADRKTIQTELQRVMRCFLSSHLNTASDLAGFIHKIFGYTTCITNAKDMQDLFTT